MDQNRLKHFETWYSNHPKYFARLTERAYWFLPYILAEVEKRGMPGEIALLPAIESAFRPDAVSRSRAVGLWQFIAATGRRYGLRQDWWVEGRRDLVQSTRAALDYLDYLEKEFDGDWELALASYNSGEGNIRRQVKHNRKLHKSTNYSSLKLRRETAEYIPKLLALRNIINDPQKFGITLNSIPDRHTLVAIDARSQTDLSVAAALIDLSADQLRYFNQGYKRGVTPPNGPHTLVVPAQHSRKMLMALNKLSYQERMRWARHEVRKGENLGRIARKYGVPLNSIISTNQLKSNLIHPGQELRIPISGSSYQYAESSLKYAQARAGDKVYKVRSGDSLWGISRRYGVSITNLTRWNRISRNTLLHPGQTLVVSR
jgi:membrane-bound lytic murein transglycosylase D